jgi:hypothetical protein
MGACLAGTVNVFLSEPVTITVPSAFILEQPGERTVNESPSLAGRDDSCTAAMSQVTRTPE